MKFREIENMTQEEMEQAMTYVRERLPPGGEILFLSLTGSRAFGWGGTLYDRDVRFVFVPVEDEFWDTCHIGIHGYDIHGEEINHLFRRMTERWTAYEDHSKAFWVNPKFDHDKFMSFVGLNNVTGHRHTVKMEVMKLRSAPAVRTALHCYRQHMEPIHFLRTEEIEINVLKINEKLKCECLDSLVEMYMTRKWKEIDYDPIFEELDQLACTLDYEIENSDMPMFDKEAHNIWTEEVLSIFNHTV